MDGFQLEDDDSFFTDCEDSSSCGSQFNDSGTSDEEVLLDQDNEELSDEVNHEDDNLANSLLKGVRCRRILTAMKTLTVQMISFVT